MVKVLLVEQGEERGYKASMYCSAGREDETGFE